jgi:hypothetical protein
MTAGHFTPRTDTLLTHAGQICAGRGARLTDLRRQVLGLILDAEGPTARRRRRPCTGRSISCWSRG